jgi:L-alanine-DL-glutamate epimerase-like enolase superfamily enzyme
VPTPRDIAGISHRLNRALHMFGRNGSFVYALSGLDLALWDLAGRAAGMPVHRLLGGAARTEVEAYASLLVYGLPHVVAGQGGRRGGGRIPSREVARGDRRGGTRGARGRRRGRRVDARPQLRVVHREGAASRRALAPADLRWVEDAIWPPEDHESMRRLRRAGMRVAAGRTPAHSSISLGCSNATRSMSRSPT